jgi:hypothetical protein
MIILFFIFVCFCYHLHDDQSELVLLPDNDPRLLERHVTATAAAAAADRRRDVKQARGEFKDFCGNGMCNENRFSCHDTQNGVCSRKCYVQTLTCCGCSSELVDGQPQCFVCENGCATDSATPACASTTNIGLIVGVSVGGVCYCLCVCGAIGGAVVVMRRKKTGTSSSPSRAVTGASPSSPRGAAAAVHMTPMNSIPNDVMFSARENPTGNTFRKRILFDFQLLFLFVSCCQFTRTNTKDYATNIWHRWSNWRFRCGSFGVK